MNRDSFENFEPNKRISEWKETELGRIPSKWSFIKASDFCEKVTDGTHDSPKKRESGSYLITSKHIKERNIDFDSAYLISQTDYEKINERSKVDQWDVIISMIGAYCGFSYLERNSLINYAVKNVGIFKTGDERKAFWLYYYTQSKIGRDYLESSRSGTSQPYITLGTLRDYPILVPDKIEEQQAIAQVLSSLDDKIDLLHRQNKTLEAISETLFRQWFIEEAQDDWDEGKIEDLFVLQRGFDLPTRNRIEGGYPIFAASGFSGYHSECKVKAPGVTTGRSGLLGEVFLVLDDFWPLNTSLYIKEFKKGTLLFSYYLLKSLDLEAFNAGSAVPTLNRNHVHEYGISIPSTSLMEDFDLKVMKNFKKIRFNRTQIQTLEKLRDTLLPKLMIGEVRVEL